MSLLSRQCPTPLPLPSPPPNSLHLCLSCLPGTLDWMENVPLPPFWYCASREHPCPLLPTSTSPQFAVLLGNLTATMQATGVCEASHVVSVSPICLPFLYSPHLLSLFGIRGPLKPSAFFFFFNFGNSRGHAVLHLVTPKAKSLATSPLACEVPTPLSSVSTQLCFLGDFKAAEGSEGRGGGQPVSLCRQLPD